MLLKTAVTCSISSILSIFSFAAGASTCPAYVSSRTISVQDSTNQNWGGMFSLATTPSYVTIQIGNNGAAGTVNCAYTIVGTREQIVLNPQFAYTHAFPTGMNWQQISPSRSQPVTFACYGDLTQCQFWIGQ